MPSTLALCECRHAAFEHHFNEYQGSKGESGRGKCAYNNSMTPAKKRCKCVSYTPAKVKAKR